MDILKKIDDYLEFLLKEKGESILYKGQEQKAIISDATDNINFYDDKYIRIDFEIRTGDTIGYQNNIWLVISEIDKNRLSYKAKIRKSNYNIKIVVEEVLCEFISIIEGVNLGIDVGKFMSLEDGKIKATVPADDISNNIDTNMRFIKMGKAWKVVGVDKSKVGLNILHCKKDVYSANDDKEDEIANKDRIEV